MEGPNIYKYEIGYVQGVYVGIDATLSLVDADPILKSIVKESVLAGLREQRPSVFENYEKGIQMP